ETSQEEPPITSWNELSIIERVGLNSVEMSEKDLETAFSQITLAFRCDQYTLKQRLQAEEHARNLAEENVQLELSRGRETLETLKGLCLDSKRSKILQKLELSLDILGGTVERISNTAEVLGAVHQEARVSRAVELMVAHVENLRSRYDRNAAELEEAKRMVQQPTYCRNIIDPRASPDPDDSDNKKIYISAEKRAAHGGSSNKKSTRTCPSPSQSSESGCSVMTKEDNCSVDDRSPLDTLRQRHKGKSALPKKKADKDKKSANVCRRVSAGHTRIFVETASSGSLVASLSLGALLHLPVCAFLYHNTDLLLVGGIVTERRHSYQDAVTVLLNTECADQLK
ncbi:Lymphoid-restricted membrane protein, partial [Nibea albiflora]